MSHPSENAVIEKELREAFTLHSNGQLEKAILGYQRILALRPDNADAIKLLATALSQSGRFSEALGLFDRACELMPSDPQIHNNRGLTQQKLGLFAESLSSYGQAIRLHANYPDAHFNCGNALRSLNRLDEALQSYEHAIRLRPDYAAASMNLGATLSALGRFDEALRCYDRVIEATPGNVDAHYCRGNVLVDLGSFDEALVSYDFAISLNAEYAKAHFNKGILLLLLGRYREGWASFEWRLKTEEMAKHYPVFHGKTPWRGSRDISGQIILIQGEQGLGDIIQFSRYLPKIEALGAKAIVQVKADVLNLVRSVRSAHIAIADTEALPEFDFYCPMMSLPYAFGTDFASLPNETPYIHADEAKIRTWQERLGPRRRPRIGIAWSGAPVHDNDANRSIPLKTLVPLFNDSIEWHSLQKEVREHDLQTLQSLPEIQRHAPLLRDFSDTAALIECMDLVLSVDTSIAHVAGALGKRTLIMLPFRPDYRWMLNRPDTPWYPKALLLRQTRRGNWHDVIEAAKRELSKLAEAVS